MADFILKAGIEFTPTDASRRSIQRAVNSALADFEVKLEKAKLTTAAIGQIRDQLASTVFTIGRALFTGEALRSLKGQIIDSSFAIGRSQFAGKARDTLRAEFEQIPFTVRNVRIAAEAQKTISEVAARGAPAPKVGAAGAAIAAGKPGEKTFADRFTELKTALKGADIGLAPIKSLEGLSASQQKAAIEASKLQRAFQQLGPASSKGITDASTKLVELREVIGSIAGRAGIVVGDTTALGQAAAAAQVGITSESGALQNQLRILAAVSAEQQRFNAAKKGQVFSTAGVGAQVSALQGVRTEIASVTGASTKAVDSNKLVASSFQGAGLSAESFGARLLTITARFGTYLVAIKAVLAVQQAFRGSLDAIVEFDNVLQDLRKVVQDTPAGLSQLSESLFGVAKRTGGALNDVAGALNSFVRQGGTVEDALRKTEAAMIATNISELKQDEATKLITASSKIFGAELRNEIQALDIISVAADKTAAQADEISRAFIQTASTAKTAGVSFNQLIAILASTIDRTQEAGGKVGNAMKTIFTRIKTNTGAFRENANALGANIGVQDDAVTVLTKLSVLFKTLDSNQKTQLATQVAGLRQVNVFIGAIESLNKAQELEVQQTDSAGTALEKQRREMEKLSTQARVLATSLKEFIVVLTSTDKGAGAVGGIRNSFSSVITSITDAVQLVTAFEKSIKEVTGSGLQLTSIFSGISKTLFFTIGANIAKSLAVGIKQAFVGAQSLTVALRGVAETLLLGKNAAAQVVSTEQQTLAVEQKRIAANQKILEFKKQEARISGGAVATQAAATPRSFDKLLKTAGVVTGLQVITDAARETAAGLEENAQGNDRFAASILRASSAGIDLGTTIGLVTGNLKTGLLAGIISAGANFANFALQQSKNAEAVKKAVVDEAKQRLSGIEALRSGNATLKKVFEDEAKNTGQPVRQIVLQASEAFSRALAIASTQAADALSNAGKAFEDIRSDITTSVRTFELKKAVSDATEQFRTRGAKAKLVQAGGPLGNFEEVDTILTETVTEAEKLIGPITNTGNAVATMVRSMAAFNSLQKDSTVRAADVLKQFQLESPALQRLQQDFSGIKDRIEQQVSALSTAQGEVDFLKNKLKEVTAQAAKGAESTAGMTNAFDDGGNAAAELAKRVAEFNKRIEEGNKSVNGIQQSIDQLTGQEAALTDEITKSSEDQLKIVKDLATTYGKLVEFLKAAREETLAQIPVLKDQTDDLNRQIQFEQGLRQARQDGLTSQEQLGEIQARSTKEVEHRLQTEDRGHARIVARLKEQADLLAVVGDKAKSAELLNLADELDKAFKEKRAALSVQLKAEVQVELDKNLEQFVKDQQKALADFQIGELHRVLGEEQRVADKRVQLLKDIGGTAVGKEVFAGLFRDLPDQAKRQFGTVGAAILKVQEGSLDDFARAVQAEFKQLSKTGLTSLEKLSEAQRLQNALIEKNREQLDSRREAALERGKVAAERVNAAEERLANARSQLPAANEKIIEADKGIAAANVAVEEATKGLIAAYQAAADAQAQLQFEIGLATFQVKQQTGSFGTIAEEMGALRNVFNTVTNDIKVSETTRLQLARQVAQEQLNLLQQQFEAVKSIGLQAATAGADQLAQLQNAVGAAVEIQRGQANVSDFSPDIIQALSSLPDQLFPGLQRAIAEFGLERLGVDPKTLTNIEDEMTQLARITADTNREQLIAANEQIRISQQQLAQTDAEKSFAQDQLTVAREQKAAILQNVGIATTNVITARSGFAQTVQEVSRTVEAINSTTAATNQVDQTLQTIAGIIRDQTSSIQGAISAAQAVATPNAAAGTLSRGELGGLFAAAKREKRAMPAGSSLMVANSSETVLTRRQARAFGLRPIPMAGAADGNAASDITGLQQTVGLLNTTVNSLLTRVNSPGFIQQDINISVDSEKTVNLRGADAFHETVRQTLADKFGKVAAKEDVDAIAGALGSVVQRLSEEGIVTSRGT